MGQEGVKGFQVLPVYILPPLGLQQFEYKHGFWILSTDVCPAAINVGKISERGMKKGHKKNGLLFSKEVIQLWCLPQWLFLSVPSHGGKIMNFSQNAKNILGDVGVLVEIMKLWWPQVTSSWPKPEWTSPGWWGLTKQHLWPWDINRFSKPDNLARGNYMTLWLQD